MWKMKNYYHSPKIFRQMSSSVISSIFMEFGEKIRWNGIFRKNCPIKYVNDFRISDRYLTSKENNCGKIENSLLRHSVEFSEFYCPSIIAKIVTFFRENNTLKVVTVKHLFKSWLLLLFRPILPKSGLYFWNLEGSKF